MIASSGQWHDISENAMRLDTDQTECVEMDIEDGLWMSGHSRVAKHSAAFVVIPHVKCVVTSPAE